LTVQLASFLPFPTVPVVGTIRTLSWMQQLMNKNIAATDEYSKTAECMATTRTIMYCCSPATDNNMLDQWHT